MSNDAKNPLLQVLVDAAGAGAVKNKTITLALSESALVLSCSLSLYIYTNCVEVAGNKKISSVVALY